MGIARIGCAAAALLVLALPAAAQAPAEFDAEGYRTARYRSPVTRHSRPAPRLAMVAALALRPGRDALFVDVMPVEGGVRDGASGAWQLSQSHETIPGAQWHPETGRAPVDPVLWAGLRHAINKARRAAPALPVIVFCRADCWMSWNAARRLAAEGTANVWWLAEGTDGWHAAGRALAPAAPTAIPGKNPAKGE